MVDLRLDVVEYKDQELHVLVQQWFGLQDALRVIGVGLQCFAEAPAEVLVDDKHDFVQDVAERQALHMHLPWHWHHVL